MALESTGAIETHEANETHHAESPAPMERLPVTRTCTHADGTVLRCAYHWAEAQGYVRTPFHGGRVAGWKPVNSLTTKIPIKSTDRPCRWT